MSEIKRVNSIPRGFRKIGGGLTSPAGYTWYSNGKSRFKPGYESVLVKSRFRFTELSPSAQKVAIKNYIKGWKELRQETFTTKQAREFCIDINDEVYYNRTGRDL